MRSRRDVATFCRDVISREYFRDKFENVLYYSEIIVIY